MTLAHPDASISDHAHLGPGSIALAGCRIAAGAHVGELAHLGANSVISHDCRIGAAAAVSHGASLGGHVTVGDRTMIGINAAVRERLTVGKDAVVTAGAVVVTDVPDLVVIGGVSGRSMRGRERGEQYLR
jgi:UDP-3-O-[3-hydroxymyristoyl] glucosamine N-acyltransferase